MFNNTNKLVAYTEFLVLVLKGTAAGNGLDDNFIY